jgi:hypothetical protein
VSDVKVWTTHGLVDRAALTVKDVVTETSEARVIATEWHMGEELVRRDVNVNVLVGHLVGVEQGG